MVVLTILCVVALVLALAACACAYGLFRSSSGAAGMGDVLKELLGAIKSLTKETDIDEWLLSKLAEYARLAVHAIQQRYHKGEITADERKDAALGLIQDFALVDGIELDTAALGIASELIEAECDAMGHTYNDEPPEPIETERE